MFWWESAIKEVICKVIDWETLKKDKNFFFWFSRKRWLRWLFGIFDSNHFRMCNHRNRNWNSNLCGWNCWGWKYLLSLYLLGYRYFFSSNYEIIQFFHFFFYFCCTKINFYLAISLYFFRASPWSRRLVLWLVHNKIKLL